MSKTQEKPMLFKMTNEQHHMIKVHAAYRGLTMKDLFITLVEKDKRNFEK